MIFKVFLLLVGIGVLLVGADFLVRGSRDIAMRLGVSTLIIGLTVVAFGTSAPELFVSVAAAIDGTADVAVGNVVGSNIFNILVIIGITAFLTPVNVAKSVQKREYPFMLLTLGLMVFFASDGTISRAEGAIFLVGLLGYLFLNYWEVTRAERVVIEEFDEETIGAEKPGPVLHSALFVVGGLIGLIIGAELIVDNAVWCARQIGVSELLIGVTLVAVG
ncbi:MAG: hypothetical protein KDD70_18105, partial [Bdellovibrionales bacterium]|nr:hypothetical protein [Bdellovibrionales bacterium]